VNVTLLKKGSGGPEDEIHVTGDVAIFKVLTTAV
jgi:hypothetical protein